MKKNISLVAKNTLYILRLFTKNDNLSVRDITEISGLNVSTVYRIVNTLVNQNYIVLTDSNKYTLNGEIILQFYKMVSKDLKQYIEPLMKELVFDLKESVYLSKLNEDKKVMIVEKEDGLAKLQWVENIGYSYDIPIGTGGKAHLAYLLKDSTENEKVEFINQLTLRKYTSSSITDKQDLLNDIKKILIEGYSLTKGEHIEGIIGISVPIFSSKEDYTGYILTVIFPSVRYYETEKYDYISKMKNTAMQIGKYIT